MKRPNGAFRRLVEDGSRCVSSECLDCGRSKRPTYELDGVSMNASRAVWVIAHGDPGEMHVLHRCGNWRCLNVSHMYLGTPADNTQDTVLMGRSTNAVITDPTIAAEIGARYIPGKKGAGNGNIAKLSAEYGISYAAVRLAARRAQRYMLRVSSK